MKTTDAWQNCYPSSWKGKIVEAAFQHPAKFSDKLIRRIYDHMAQEGWIEEGQTIVDPFGGVALGAMDAMRLGLNWIGCELEERFVVMGNTNIVLWNSRFSNMPKWSGQAVLLQGDSRFLAKVLERASYGGLVSSPPYAETEITSQSNFKSTENPDGKSAKDVHRGRDKGYQAAVSSPPFSDVLSRDNVSASDRRSLADKEGISNTAHVSPIDMEKIGKRNQKAYGGLDTSPPYADSINSENGIDVTKMADGNHAGRNSQAHQETRYGIQGAQLGAMKATSRGFDAAVSSPPFQHTSGWCNVTSVTGPLADKALLDRHAAGNMNVGYGDTDGNMGTASSDEFWTAAREIVEQVYKVLEPGAHAVWVVKNYVKGGKEVPFCAQWQQMCEAVGFETLHEHHAMLVRHVGLAQTDMITGKRISKEVSSKSFFRRIAEKKGSPPIDFECVLCMVKPSPTK